MSEIDSSNLMNKICIPALLVIGTFGNILSIVIFNKKSLKEYSTFQYLSLICVIDLCVLYTGCGQIWIEQLFQIDIRTINNFFCKFHSFLVYYLTHFSSMLLASMSIDRTIAILSGNSTKKIKPKKTFKIFLLLALVTAFFNFHFLIYMRLFSISKDSDSKSLFKNESHIEMIQCYADGKHSENYFIYLTNIFPWIDLTIYALLPFLIMIITSLIIVITTYQKSSKLKPSSKSQCKKHNQLIIVLFVTDAVFISLVSPLASFMIKIFNLIF